MNRQQLASRARVAIDGRLTAVEAEALQPPPRGWVRAIRDALGMTSRQMASRLGVSHSAIAQLERSEAAGTVRMATLRRAADALDCDVVYALIPRVGLQETVRRQGEIRARQGVGLADRTMRLEDQALTPEQIRRRLDDYAAHLVAAGNLWETPYP